METLIRLQDRLRRASNFGGPLTQRRVQNDVNVALRHLGLSFADFEILMREHVRHQGFIEDS